MRLTFELELDRETAFEAIVDELHLALNRTGIELQTGAAGELLQSGAPIGRVTRWTPPEQFAIEWIPAAWQTEDRLHCTMRFEPITGGTLVTVDQPGWSKRLNDDAHESAGWIAGQVLTDARRHVTGWIRRLADRPSGTASCWTARARYVSRPHLSPAQFSRDPGHSASAACRFPRRNRLWGRCLSEGRAPKRLPCSGYRSQRGHGAHGLGTQLRFDCRGTSRDSPGRCRLFTFRR